MMKARFDFSQDEFRMQVELDLVEKGVSAIFGPSGCGKTSLLRAIAGLDKHANCEIGFAQQQWQSSNKFVPTDQRSIAYVFQEASLFTHLNVQRNLEYAIKRVPKNVQKIPFEQVVDLLKISHLLEAKTQTLSGGERQRVALARALLSSPQLLLMDEPLSALDLEAKGEILNFIEQCHKQMGIPIIYVSHSLEEVSRLADYLLLMNAGKIINHGPVEQMLTELSSPLALADNAGAIIDASVAGFDSEFNLTFLDSSLGRFTVAMPDLKSGSEVRLRLAARDISLTLEAQTGTSILNIFPAKVDEIQSLDGALVNVRLLVNNTAILARLTKKSATMMQLKSGSDVFAQVKSVALV